MVDFPGYLDQMTGIQATQFFLPSKDKGLGYPPVSNGLEPLRRDYPAVDDLEFVDDGFPTAPPEDDHAGFFQFGTSMDHVWFDRVHLLPRTKIDFGNIATAVDDRFEIFSAFKLQSGAVTNTLVANDPSLGIDLPDFPTPPSVLQPFESYLDPTSGPLAPVEQIVRALAQGAAAFDSSIDFTFDSGAGTVKLLAAGQRIALLSPDIFEGDVEETLEWQTEILPKQNGKEQRISQRKQPRQLFRMRLRSEGVDRATIQSLLFDWQSNVFAIPLWWEDMTLATAVTAPTNTITLDSTDFRDIRVGGLAVVYETRTKFEVVTVTAKTSTTLTFNSQLLNTYAVGTVVMPARTCHAAPLIQGQRYPVKVEDFTIQFRCTENDLGAPTPDSSAFSTYNSRTLIDSCNLMRGTTAQTSYEKQVTVIDNETGIVTQSSNWDHNKRGSRRGFFLRDRQELFEYRQLLYDLHGRQKAFYVPTETEEIFTSQDVIASQFTWDVEFMGYTRFVRQRSSRDVVKITFTDNPALIRTIQSSTQLSATEERLTVDVAWPNNQAVATFERAEFYELVRLDTDSVRILHERAGRAKSFVPVKMVFDDD